MILVVALMMFCDIAAAVDSFDIQKEVADLKHQLLQASSTSAQLQKLKSKDISENQKKLFKVLQKQAGSEIHIFDMNQPNVEEWRENLADMRLSIVAQDINLKKNFVPPAKPNVNAAVKKWADACDTGNEQHELDERTAVFI